MARSASCSTSNCGLQLTLCLERQTYTDKGEPDKDPKKGHDHMNDAAGYFIAKRYPIKAIVTSIKMGYAR